MRVRAIPSLCIGITALLATGGTAIVAQSLPTTQPKIIQVSRELIKTGQSAPHEANEVGWPAAFALAKSPDYYLAMESVTGRPEVWFVAPYESYTAMGKSMTQNEANPELSATLGRLAAADAQYLDGVDTFEATAEPDLSYGAFPDLNKARFWEISTWRIRPGHDQDFAAATAAYKKIVAKTAPSASWRTYKVSEGMPGGTYLTFSSVTSLAQLDTMMTEDAATGKAMTPQDQAMFAKFFAESVISITSNRYRLSPTMSYVSPETRATDPKFWNKK
jgi:hypothetical protein